jgi:RNA polymerase sigma factor (TIGR02999 family)
MTEITELLGAARDGDRAAQSVLYAQVYDRLHGLAKGQQRGHQRVADTTSLVHEAYLKMALPSSLAVENRAHFFAVAGSAMRQIVIDRARSALALKRGGGVAALSLDAADGESLPDDPQSLVQVDAALAKLRELDARLATLVELKVFGGLDVEELADALAISERTVKRWWRQARAVLIAAFGT